MPQLFIIKICFAIKVNSICGAGRDTWNLRHKFHSQGPALRILGLRIAISKSQRPISRVLCLSVPVPGSWDLRSQVLIFDYPKKLIHVITLRYYVIVYVIFLKLITCWEINQVTSKYAKWIFGQYLKKKKV